MYYMTLSLFADACPITDHAQTVQEHSYALQELVHADGRSRPPV